MGKQERQSKRKSKKLEIVFDDKSRREFLTGFRKRKNERKKVARVKFEQLLKEETKRIKDEVKNSVKHFKKSYEPIQEFEDILKEEEFENDQVTVKVVDISTSEIIPQEEYDSSNDENSEINDLPVEEEREDIPGMSFREKATIKTVKKPEKKDPVVKSKRDLDRAKQKQTLKEIKKSKLFKMKQRLNRQEDKKKARGKKNTYVRELKKKGQKIPHRKSKSEFAKKNAKRSR